jgi:hypothetical protein
MWVVMMVINDTSDNGVEELIAWHREKAEYYSDTSLAMKSEMFRKAHHECGQHHLTTAELLEELLRWRDDYIEYDD